MNLLLLRGPRIDFVREKGKIGIFDHDTVELSNLQRQILHNEETLGIYKADSAKQSLQRFASFGYTQTTPI